MVYGVLSPLSTCTTPPRKLLEAIDDSQTESEKLELSLFKDFSFLEQHVQYETRHSTRAVIIRTVDRFDFFREQKTPKLPPESATGSEYR